MHALHRILVRISDNWDNEVSAKEVRDFAVQRTEEFFNIVYDWRETDTAGRWSVHYPNNVIFSCDDIDRFIDELKTAAEYQAEEKNRCLGLVKKEMGTEIIDEIVFGKQTHMSAYYLNQLGKIVYGEYYFDSMFYNTAEYNSIVNEKLIEEVKEHPDDWAMVFFDYHY